MKRVTWASREPGDIFLAAVPGFPNPQIWQAELVLHPEAPTDFKPTHAGIVGFPDEKGHGTVVEAWLDVVQHQNSVACINPAAKYANYESALELWRSTAFNPAGLKAYIAAYGPQKYGLLNLFGFEWIAFVKLVTRRNVENPIECSEVCSQGVVIELGTYQAAQFAIFPEHWAHAAACNDNTLRNLDPLELRMMLLAHED